MAGTREAHFKYEIILKNVLKKLKKVMVVFLVKHTLDLELHNGT